MEFIYCEKLDIVKLSEAAREYTIRKIIPDLRRQMGNSDISLRHLTPVSFGSQWCSPLFKLFNKIEERGK